MSSFFPLHRACRAGNTIEIKRHAERLMEVKRLDAKKRSPLHIACKYAKLDACEILLSKNAPLDLRDHNGFLPFHFAASSGSLEIIECLFLHKPNIDETTEQGDTALLLACRKHRPECFRFLLSNGADCLMMNKVGETALDIALKEGYTEIAHEYLNHFTNYNHQYTNGKTALLLACSFADSVISTFLLDREANVAIKSDTGDLPVHMVCKTGLDDVLQLILDLEECPIDVPNLKGETPLHFAAAHGHHNCIRTLLNRGAQLDSQAENGSSPLHLACEHDHIVCVDTLLEGDADLHICTKQKWTALHTACYYGIPRAAGLLIEGGADVDARAADGSTPLHFACQKGNVSCALKLLHESASTCAINESGDTMLHCAINGGQIEIIKAIITTKCVDINARNKVGDSPTQMASRSHLECLQLLLTNGAELDRPESAPLLHYGQISHAPEDAPIVRHPNESPVLYMATMNDLEQCQRLLFERLATKDQQIDVLKMFLVSLDDNQGSNGSANSKGIKALEQNNSGQTDIALIKSPRTSLDISFEPSSVVNGYGRVRQYPRRQELLVPLYRSHIAKNCDVLSRHMDPESVLNALYKHGIVPHESLQNYKTSSLGPISASRVILSVMSEQSKEFFDKAIPVLEKEGLLNTAQLLTGRIECKVLAHWKVLQEHRDFLHENLDGINSVCSYLFSKNVLSTSECERINLSRDARCDQTYVLLDILTRHSEEDFSVFLEALGACSQNHLAQPLRDSLEKQKKNDEREALN